MSDERDTARLMDGVRLAYSIFGGSAAKALRGEVFAPTASRLIHGLGPPRLRNQLASLVIAEMLDGPSRLRRTILVRIGRSLDGLIEDNGALRRFVRENAVPLGHVAGTCRMGRRENPDAVVNSECRVHGVGGIRVVDTSIIRANTNIPVIMIAEKAASMIARND